MRKEPMIIEDVAAELREAMLLPIVARKGSLWEHEGASVEAGPRLGSAGCRPRADAKAQPRRSGGRARREGKARGQGTARRIGIRSFLKQPRLALC